MARVPQNVPLEVQYVARDLNQEIRALTKRVDEIVKGLPSSKEVEEIKQALIRLSKTPTYLDPLDNFRASGPAHSHGYVPTPGPIAGTQKFLREDATWQPASGGTPGPHTHHDSEITHTPAGFIAGDTVEEALNELDDEKLARSGAQPMLGDLNMNNNDILNVYNLFFSGPVGQAIIDAVRTIYMTGAGEITGVKLIDMSVSGAGEGVIYEVRHINMNGIGRVDDIREGLYFDSNPGEGLIDGPRLINMEGNDFDLEARIQNLNRIGWNTTVVSDDNYTPEEGRESWDETENDLVTYIQSGTDPQVVKIALGWDVLMCKVEPAGEGPTTVSRGQAVMQNGQAGQYALVRPAVLPSPENPELFDTYRVLGIAMTNAVSDEFVAVLRRGYIRNLFNSGLGSGSGTPVWVDPSSGDITTTRPDAPNPQYFVGVITNDNDGGSPFDIAVDVRTIPNIGELSSVQREDPEQRDVFVYDEDTQTWIPRPIRPSRTVTSDELLTKDDWLVRVSASDGPVTVDLPVLTGFGDPTSANHVIIVKKVDDTSNQVIVDGNGGAIDDAGQHILLKQGESLAVQSDGNNWVVI